MEEVAVQEREVRHRWDEGGNRLFEGDHRQKLSTTQRTHALCHCAPKGTNDTDGQGKSEPAAVGIEKRDVRTSAKVFARRSSTGSTLLNPAKRSPCRFRLSLRRGLPNRPRRRTPRSRPEKREDKEAHIREDLMFHM